MRFIARARQIARREGFRGFAAEDFKAMERAAVGLVTLLRES